MGCKKGDTVEVDGPARRAEVQDPRDQGRLSAADACAGVARSRVGTTRPHRAARGLSVARAWPLGSAMEIVRLRADQVGEASEMLARAFQDDPAWEWVLPNARRRAALLPWLFRVELRGDRGRGLGDRRARSLGCARWLPPGPAADPRRADAAGARRDAAPRRARRPRASSPTAARSRRCAPPPCPSRTGTSPGSASTRQPAAGDRHRAAAARASRHSTARRGPVRAADEQRGEPRLLRGPRLRGRAGGPDARRTARTPG